MVLIIHFSPVQSFQEEEDWLSDPAPDTLAEHHVDAGSEGRDISKKFFSTKKFYQWALV